ncbi:MAG: hypothetical protein WD794_05540 [Mycobacteriales bacterium]
MEDLLENATRCPHCRAAARPGAPWCTLCHADLRPPPPEPFPPVLDPVPVLRQPMLRPLVLDPLTAPAHELGLAPAPHALGPAPAPHALGPTPHPVEPTWPCVTCGAANPLSGDACSACGAGFLAGLRESDGPLLELPGLGDLTRMSRSQRLMLAGAVVFAVVALTALLGLLVG